MSTTNPLEAFVVLRRKYLGRFGPMAADAFLGMARCTNCNGVDVFTVGLNFRPIYESLADFVRHAEATGQSAVAHRPA